MISAASASLCEAWNSPSAAITLARRSRSASACAAIARCISCGRSIFFSSTSVTLTPHGSVCASTISWMLRVEFVALAQQLVEFRLPADRAQRGLRELHRGEQVVLDLDHGPRRIDDAKIQHRADFHRHVVAGDDVLRRNVQRHRPQIDSRHPLEHRDNESHARPAIRREPAEAKDHAALVLVEHLEPAQDENEPMKITIPTPPAIALLLRPLCARGSRYAAPFRRRYASF